MTYPELQPEFSDEDVEVLWECLGISPEELIEMKEQQKEKDATNIKL